MSHRVIQKVALACAAGATALAATPVGMASASASTSPQRATQSSAPATCPLPTLTEPFAPLDPNLYALAPGESADDFAGTGWTLLGSSIVSTKLNDGTTGNVLDLPAGSVAISPPMCITDQCPTARAIGRDLKGPGGATIEVAYVAGKALSLSSGTITGTSSSWSLGPVVNLTPSTTAGAQLAVFTFVGGASGSDSQLYDFYIDPKQRG